MFLTMTLMIMMLINMTFSMMIHPLMITLLIIVQTLMICTITGPNSHSFWFSYILFMIFLGGMLVLFIYITSLASNEVFQMPIKIIMMSSLMVFLLMLLSPMTSHMMNYHTNKFDYMENNNNLMSMELYNLNQLYNYPNATLTIMTILYLLITLIAIVKITQFHEGPLRHSN
uniref:NADH-ubiquinone oxidoreductase chain 6 n=1 Tax=Turanogryllus eous TaxID=2823019 RepID=A0A8A6W4G5_9ORTH|nr:NADH dehydrogenase subunit 6 [Turanogryllus eous]QTK22278.1 NADH dehydrogenase subunit 6 [Turanogryllus eous]